MQLVFSIFIICCGILLFCQDSGLVREWSNGLYLAGVCIQGYLLIIVLRDIVITVIYFKKGERDALLTVLLTHYLTSCLDLMLLSVLFLWALAAVLSLPQIDSDRTHLLDADILTFTTVTRINTMLAFAYIISHCCFMPVITWCVLRRPEMLR